MFVKPAPGKRVRDPQSKLPIPETGLEVPEDSYWTRAIIAGDVVRASRAPAAAPTAPKVSTISQKVKE